MNNLIIDASNKKILFKLITNKQTYTTDFINSRENFNNLTNLLFMFLEKNNFLLKKVNNILINQGPGSFSGIRSSIAVAKALRIVNNLDIYGFDSSEVIGKNYENLINLLKRGKLKKNMIKPIYNEEI